jgi:hypothetical protein
MYDYTLIIIHKQKLDFETNFDCQFDYFVRGSNEVKGKLEFIFVRFKSNRFGRLNICIENGKIREEKREREREREREKVRVREFVRE